MYNILIENFKIAQKVVFFTGAGISTESGIPDFRSANGLYFQNKFRGASPEQILSRSYFNNFPEIFYEYYFDKIINTQANPNPGHLAMAEVEKLGYKTTVITQNIDGLHSKAGSTNVLELHGTVYKNTCTKCKKKYDLDYIIKNSPEVPKCERCNSLVRPCVTLYEEALNKRVFLKSRYAIASADILIAAGSSLTVNPAAGLLKKYRGNSFVIINKTATPYDKKANFVFRKSCGSMLTKIVKGLKSE